MDQKAWSASAGALRSQKSQHLRTGGVQLPLGLRTACDACVGNVLEYHQTGPVSKTCYKQIIDQHKKY
eukprot:3583693-Amphidinium_carterae.1